MASDRETSRPDHTEVEIQELPRGGPTRFCFDGDGKVRIVSEATVSESRLRRARRIYWEESQKPEWGRTHKGYYHHPSLRNVPYRVLKDLAKEMEAT